MSEQKKDKAKAMALVKAFRLLAETVKKSCYCKKISVINEICFNCQRLRAATEILKAVR